MFQMSITASTDRRQAHCVQVAVGLHSEHFAKPQRFSGPEHPVLPASSDARRERQPLGATRQEASPDVRPGAMSHIFGEWHDYPSPVHPQWYTPFTVHAGEQWSWSLNNGTGTTWNMYISPSSRIAQVTTWYLYGSTPAMVANRRWPETEASRPTAGSGTAANFFDIGRQTSFNGAWAPFTNLACDHSQDNLLDWKGIKGSSTSWWTVFGTPSATQC